jgi:hypothetical protein
VQPEPPEQPRGRRGEGGVGPGEHRPHLAHDVASVQRAQPVECQNSDTPLSWTNGDSRTAGSGQQGRGRAAAAGHLQRLLRGVHLGGEEGRRPGQPLLLGAVCGTRAYAEPPGG